MNLTIYQVDAFTDELFKGNPAAVCPLQEWLSDELMQQIAAENNLSETAFFVPRGDDFELRWFTPAREVRLCGHATLATAHVLYHHMGYKEGAIVFHTQSGELEVRRSGDAYNMDFPTDEIQQIERPSPLFQEVLGIEPVEVWKGIDDFMVVLNSYDEIIGLYPDFVKMKTINARGVLVTAPGKDTDFVSRGFFPAYGVDEDPVTGSAHTTLAPYWAERLGKTEMTALQASQRTGRLHCSYKGDRIRLIGDAKTYMIGTIWVK